MVEDTMEWVIRSQRACAEKYRDVEISQLGFSEEKKFCYLEYKNGEHIVFIDEGGKYLVGYFAKDEEPTMEKFTFLFRENRHDGIDVEIVKAIDWLISDILAKPVLLLDVKPGTTKEYLSAFNEVDSKLFKFLIDMHICITGDYYLMPARIL